MFAVFSWRYIERPFRSKKIPIRRVRYAALGGTVMLGLLGVSVLVHDGYPSRLNHDAARINASVGDLYQCSVLDNILVNHYRTCMLELPSRKPEDADVVLLGNSHVQMYAPVFRQILRDLSLKGLMVPAGGCLPTTDSNVSAECLNVAKKQINVITSLKHAKVVVIGTTWPRAPLVSDNKSYRNSSVVTALDKTIDRLRSSGKTIVLIGPLSVPNWDVPSIVSRSLAFGIPIGRPLFNSQKTFENDYKDVISHFERRQDIVFVRPDRIQCSNGRCDFILDGRSLFADSNHLAAMEIYRFRQLFELALKRALTMKSAKARNVISVDVQL